MASETRNKFWTQLSVPRILTREKIIEADWSVQEKAWIHGTILRRLMGDGMDSIPFFPLLNNEETTQHLQRLGEMVALGWPLILSTNQGSAFDNSEEQMRSIKGGLLSLIGCHDIYKENPDLVRHLVLLYGRAGYFDPRDPAIPIGRDTKVATPLEKLVRIGNGPAAGAMVELGADLSLIPAEDLKINGHPVVRAGDFDGYLRNYEARGFAMVPQLRASLMTKAIQTRTAGLAGACHPGAGLGPDQAGMTGAEGDGAFGETCGAEIGAGVPLGVTPAISTPRRRGL